MLGLSVASPKALSFPPIDFFLRICQYDLLAGEIKQALLRNVRVFGAQLTPPPSDAVSKEKWVRGEVWGKRQQVL